MYYADGSDSHGGGGRAATQDILELKPNKHGKTLALNPTNYVKNFEQNALPAKEIYVVNSEKL